jgi:REP element-mobilizing transposase RayT
MRQPRSRQFDAAAAPWLHCISRCVRRAWLCGEGFEHRKAWIERRLRVLSRCLAVEVGAYAVMSNHLHVVLRPRPAAVAVEMPGLAVARAWWCLRQDVDPADGRDAAGAVQEPSAELLERLAADEAFVRVWRERLGSASWFMKELKEPLSRLANREDDCTGAFWEGRFTSVPLLDVPAIVACMAYVDLNPIRAQLAQVPEDSDFTSIKARIARRRERLAAAREGAAGTAAATAEPAVGPRVVCAVECDSAVQPAPASASAADWLTPVSVMTRTYDAADTPVGGDRGLDLDTYLRLVEATGQVIRGDKRGAIPADLAPILERLDLNVEAWIATMAKPKSLLGAVLGGVAAVAAEAQRRGAAWMQMRTGLFGGRVGVA